MAFSSAFATTASSCPRLSYNIFRKLSHIEFHSIYSVCCYYLISFKIFASKIEKTMKYIRMLYFKDDEFEVATATRLEETKQVLTAGSDYITEKNGIIPSESLKDLDV
jgi:hypothetical protein